MIAPSRTITQPIGLAPDLRSPSRASAIARRMNPVSPSGSDAMAVPFLGHDVSLRSIPPDELCDVDLRQGHMNKTINQSLELEFSEPDPFAVFYQAFRCGRRLVTIYNRNGVRLKDVCFLRVLIEHSH